MQKRALDRHPLAQCFRLCQSMGRTGEIIWGVAKNIEDIEERIAYVRYAVGWLREKSRDPHYRVPPFDFRTFVESEHLLNKRGYMFPLVMREAIELNSGHYIESVITGGIGVGKTYMAVYTQAYQLYLMTCMVNPHETFDLDPASSIVIIFQSLNLTTAKENDYMTFRAIVDDSPYFANEAPYDQGKKNEMRFIKQRIVVKPVSGSDTAAIGQNVIGGIIDEINFMAVVENSKNSKDGTTYDQAIAVYNSIARRRESRFMKMGSMPGMLCLVSSRNYPGQFTDKKEAEARAQIERTGKTTIFIYDKRRWEVKPEDFCGQWFNVFVGDATRKPRILVEGEEIADDDRDLVIAVPIEYYSQFENDLLPALRDIAGVATQALHPFMAKTDAVAACFGRVQSIASRDDCDFGAVKLQLFPGRIVNPTLPRFCHVDLAISKDSAGVAIGHVPGFKDMVRGDYVETLPLIHYDMILEVKPPRGGEIEFENIRKLLYTLRDKLKLPIKWVTFDDFQSKDSRQLLAQQGFVTGYQSMDTDTFAYSVLKQAFYDGRVLAPAHEKALREAITLEINTKKGKVDHPPHGSKDVSDAMAGVAVGLSMRREIWHKHGVPLSRLPSFVTEQRVGKDSIAAKEKASA